MKIDEIISQTRLYNLHSHTQFCDGRASMEDMVTAAKECGMIHYGFTPHSPICCKSGCNMPKDAVDVYLDEAKRIADNFSGKMKIWTSMEIDYIDRDFGPHIDYFQRMKLDYRLASVHFVPTKEGFPIDCDGRFERFKIRLHEEFNDDIRYVVEKFFEQTLVMLELGGFDILGHFDKIGYNASLACPDIEEQSWYEALVDDIITHSKSSGVFIEVNTKALDDHGRLFPSPKWLKKVVDANIPIVINSDAHYPDKINSGRDKAFDIIDKLKDAHLAI